MSRRVETLREIEEEMSSPESTEQEIDREACSDIDTLFGIDEGTS
jgi:hypothetical protein